MRPSPQPLDPAAPAAAARPRSRFDWGLTLIVLALNLMVLALLVLTLYDSRQRLQAQAEVTAHTLSTLVVTNLDNVFDKIDLALLGVLDQIADETPKGPISGQALQALAERPVARVPELDRIGIANASGELTYNTNAGAPQYVHIGDRAYFTDMRDHPESGLVFSNPLISRLTNEATLVMARRINQSDGRFAGVVIAPITLRELTESMSLLNTGPHGFVSLVDRHGVAVARYPATVQDLGVIGESVMTPGRERLLATRPLQGVLQELSPLDGALRTVAYAKMADYPFYVYVGLSPDDYLAEWWRSAAKMTGFMVFFLVLTLVFARVAALAWERLQRKEQQFRNVLESSPDPLILTEADGRIAVVNRQVGVLFGYTAQELIGQPIEMLIPQRHRAEHTGHRASYIAHPTVRGMGDERTLWALTKNGAEVPVSVRLSPIASEHGLMVAAAVRDVSERKLANEKIAFLAYHDALTELPNRRLLLERLQHALAASARTGNHAALLFLDLDHFKSLNDTLGHDKGDQLLCQVAQRMSACVREVDTLARLGGDEFVVLFEGLSDAAAIAATQVEALAEKIRSALDKPYVLDEHTVLSTPSIGVTLVFGQLTPIAELMKQADLAMYQSKKAGRNTVRFFDPHMQQLVSDHASLETDLRAALAQQHFALHYQPQVNALGELTGAEALLRWHHATRGWVPPIEFIALAEDSGLILPLGRWVLETACAQLVSWAQQPHTEPLTLAVNISARQLARDDFVAQVLEVLAHTGANPARLKLELTESLLVADIDTTIDKMRTLKSAGVAFALDDFGTGFSSLAYLKRLPLDQLKIDKSFVDDVLTDPNDAAIAKMIMALADSMGLTVIAEGVETALQRDALAAMGCQAYQGYFFSRPLPLAAFEIYARQTAIPTPV